LNIHAVIPLKDPTQGKTRLSRALALPRRVELIEAMLRHVAGTLAASSGIDEVSVLTGANIELPQGCTRLLDRDFELNAAVARAACELRGRGRARTLLVVHADLPFVTRADIDALVVVCQEDAVVAAADWTGSGTNALAFPLARDVMPRYGPESLAAHREAASAVGLPFVLVRRPGLAEDIDEPAQLEWLSARGGERYAFVAAAAKGVPP
jgi:2-phospho-L-lactate guanylyltransferase